MDLKRAMLLRLARKDTELYPDDPARREMIYDKYKVRSSQSLHLWLICMSEFCWMWCNQVADTSLCPCVCWLACGGETAVWGSCWGGGVGWTEFGGSSRETETPWAQGDVIGIVNKNMNAHVSAISYTRPTSVKRLWASVQSTSSPRSQ